METGYFSRTQSIEDVNLEIETLFQSTDYRKDEILEPLVSHVGDEHGWKEWRALGHVNGKSGRKARHAAHVRQPNKPGLSRIANAVWREWYKQQAKEDSVLENEESSFQDSPITEEDEFTFERDVTVFGADNGEAPTEYTLHGVKSYELPVIGTYVDKRVVPGFKYSVRNLESNKLLFKSRALPLQSIGQGYGKRITFKGDTFNENTNYFYSDTNSEGYAFSIKAVQEVQEFIICDNSDLPIGRAIVQNASMPQREIKMESKDGAVVKYVEVNLICSVIYESNAHGLMSLHSSEDGVEISGIAKAVKHRKAKEAIVECIDGVSIPGFGICSLHAEL
ncbi:unnamed protein product [Owenia fusiformis]|uniref:Uncharacterized protein n=1 Tax=Owenia fusiformis TaxID=6347 RepID=A0A8J1TAR6_OWEFU|nr:unnamed protein product [Owenia fusiformis]